jgi:hypothetical protein
LHVVKGVFRFLAGAFLLVAVIAAVNDVTRSMAAGEVLPPVSAYQHWQRLAPVTLNAAHSWVERRTDPLVWDMGVAKLLQLPAWGLLGLIGLLLAYAGRRRREINIFAN